MAAVTVYEFNEGLDINGDLSWSEAVVTSVAFGVTHAVPDEVQYLVMSTDVNNRVGINEDATTSSLPMLASAERWMKFPRTRTGRTLHFIQG